MELFKIELWSRGANNLYLNEKYQGSSTVALWVFFFSGEQREDYSKYYKFYILRKQFFSHLNKISLSELNLDMNGIAFWAFPFSQVWFHSIFPLKKMLQHLYYQWICAWLNRYIVLMVILLSNCLLVSTRISWCR